MLPASSNLQPQRTSLHFLVWCQPISWQNMSLDQIPLPGSLPTIFHNCYSCLSYRRVNLPWDTFWKRPEVKEHKIGTRLISTVSKSILTFFCNNPNSTQLDITKVGFDMKMTLHHHPPPPPPPPGTQRHQYISCY